MAERQAGIQTIGHLDPRFHGDDSWDNVVWVKYICVDKYRIVVILCKKSIIKVYLFFFLYMLQTAITAAKQAGDIIEKYFSLEPTMEFKDAGQRDIVTIADKEAEKAIREVILKEFPHHGFWGEETGQTQMDKEYVWVVDPLDGTSNFALHIPLYAISIALTRNKEPILGVVYIPTTGELFSAEKNKGAYCNNKPIKVSQINTLSTATCSVEYWSRDDLHRQEGLEDFVYFANHTKKIRYLSSTVFELCRVAKGSLDFCILDTKFIDIAAAKLIIEEAGGTCCSTKGGEIPFAENGQPTRIIASNQPLISLLLQYKK